MHSFHTVLKGPRTLEKSAATTRAGLSRGPGCAETTHARLKRKVGMEIDAIFMGGTRRQNVARPLRIPSLVAGIRLPNRQTPALLHVAGDLVIAGSYVILEPFHEKLHDFDSHGDFA